MDYFISPPVVGQNLEIHPLMVLFAVMVGGEIGGIVGIYLSIPLMVVVRVVWQKCVLAAARRLRPASSFMSGEQRVQAGLINAAPLFLLAHLSRSAPERFKSGAFGPLFVGTFRNRLVHGYKLG